MTQELQNFIDNYKQIFGLLESLSADLLNIEKKHEVIQKLPLQQLQELGETKSAQILTKYEPELVLFSKQITTLQDYMHHFLQSANMDQFMSLLEQCRHTVQEWIHAPGKGKSALEHLFEKLTYSPRLLQVLYHKRLIRGALQRFVVTSKVYADRKEVEHYVARVRSAPENLRSVGADMLAQKIEDEINHGTERTDPLAWSVFFEQLLPLVDQLEPPLARGKSVVRSLLEHTMNELHSLLDHSLTELVVDHLQPREQTLAKSYDMVSSDLDVILKSLLEGGKIAEQIMAVIEGLEKTIESQIEHVNFLNNPPVQASQQDLQRVNDQFKKLDKDKMSLRDKFIVFNQQLEEQKKHVQEMFYKLRKHLPEPYGAQLEVVLGLSQQGHVSAASTSTAGTSQEQNSSRRSA